MGSSHTRVIVVEPDILLDEERCMYVHLRSSERCKLRRLNGSNLCKGHLYYLHVPIVFDN